MKWTIAATIMCAPGMALAHAGHLGELAGHDHVVAGVAIGAAVGVAVWGWLKGKREDEAQNESDTESEPAEAEA